MNLAPETAPIPSLATGEAARWLGGVGLDWDLPGTLFLNAQLGVDHLSGATGPLVRPETDVIGTLRLQRSFANERWRAGVEIINAFDGDGGTLRPSVTWQARDSLAVDLGADIIFGDRDGLIGQFEPAERLVLRLRVAV